MAAHPGAHCCCLLLKIRMFQLLPCGAMHGFLDLAGGPWAWIIGAESIVGQFKYGVGYVNRGVR
jgi:hypothetical protein